VKGNLNKEARNLQQYQSIISRYLQLQDKGLVGASQHPSCRGNLAAAASSRSSILKIPSGCPMKSTPRLGRTP
jgi:uncharacterized protein YcnI